MPSRRSGARAAARASLGIDGALALLRSHPFAHSLHVVVPSLTQEKQRKGGGSDNGNAGGGSDVAPPPPPPSLFDLLPKPPPYLCVPALNLADLTTPQFVAWAFPERGEEGGEEGGGEGEGEHPGNGGACGLAAPASLDAGGGAALSPDGRLLLALPAEERRRAGDPSPGASLRDPSGMGGGGGWYLSEIFLTAGRRGRRRAKAKAAARAAREGKKKAAGDDEATMEEAEEEEGAAGATPAEHRPLAKARERLAGATLPVPFALLPPSCSSSSSSSSSSPLPPPPLPGAREVWPRERRRLRARAPAPPFPDFARFFGRRKGRLPGALKDRGEEEQQMEVDEKEGEATAAATGAKEEEEEDEEDENSVDDGDDDRERLAEALEWLGLAASLSSPSVTLAECGESSSEEEKKKAAGFVDVCSFEGLLGSGFARRALEAAAAAVEGAAAAPAAEDNGDPLLPWAALVLVGFPDSPLSWTRGSNGLPTKATETTEAAAKKKDKEKKNKKASSSSSSWGPEPVRLGPEACREHALFVVVVRGGEKEEGGGSSSSGCRFLAAVASGGGDGFDARLL